MILTLRRPNIPNARYASLTSDRVNVRGDNSVSGAISVSTKILKSVVTANREPAMWSGVNVAAKNVLAVVKVDDVVPKNIDHFSWRREPPRRRSSTSDPLFGCQSVSPHISCVDIIEELVETSHLCRLNCLARNQRTLECPQRCAANRCCAIRGPNKPELGIDRRTLQLAVTIRIKTEPSGNSQPCLRSVRCVEVTV